MGRSKIKLELIQNHQKRKSTFEGRKVGLIKKISELSTLCDIKACVIIYDENHKQEVWPHDPNRVQELINLYKKQPLEGRSKRTNNLSSFFRYEKRKIANGIAKLKKKKKTKNADQKYPTWDSRFDSSSAEESRNFARVIEEKIEIAKQKLQFLKGKIVQDSKIGSLVSQKIWDYPEMMMNQTPQGIVQGYFSVLDLSVPMATNSSSNILQLNEVIVAFVPWPEHGHLNQLFHVANFISSHNIPVHFISLTDRNNDLKLRVQHGIKNIHFNDLLVPAMTEKAKTQDDKWADQYLFLQFLENFAEPIYQTCLELSTNTKKLVIIYDSLMENFIGDVYSIPNVESFAFHAISAFTMYSTHQQILLHTVDEDHDKMVCELFDEFPRVEDCFGPYIVDYVKKGREKDLKYSGEFMNSCRELEGKYLDLLANVKNKPLWALGPFHMLIESVDPLCSSNRMRHECLEFLDKQDVNSVIFVSFGTTTTFSQEQVNELALGLEQSNHKFIWVLREADKKMDMENFEGKDGNFKLPDGFEERVEGRGMVARNWVPQLEILGHPSTGGFMSHCGWNSCMESITNGVPIAAWPIHVDQPYNAIFVTNVLKIGISVRNWARREELVTTPSVEKAVKTLMGMPEGEEMRQRAIHFSNRIKSSLSHGGPIHKETESFISYITR